ncbi:inorganic diphosphatase [Ileibacterium valens]
MKQTVKELENNIYFWQKLDTLMLSGKLVIDRPKNSAHPDYPNMIYPVDYGYLKDTLSSDQEPIDAFKGTIRTNQVTQIAVAADILKKDCEVKLLIGCTEEETLDVMKMLNGTEFRKAILIRRGNSAPSYAESD